MFLMSTQSCHVVSRNVFQINLVETDFSTIITVRGWLVNQLMHFLPPALAPLAFSSNTNDMLLCLCSDPGHRGDDEHSTERAPGAGAAELGQTRP